MFRAWKGAFGDLQHQVDQIFEDLIYRPWSIAGPREWRPAMDLHETPDAYQLDIDLPGVPPDQVRILVREGELLVEGRRPETRVEDIVFNRCERPCGEFRRAWKLPQAVDPARAKAECFHGTYRIRLPKKRAAEQSAPPGGHFVLHVTVRQAAD